MSLFGTSGIRGVIGQEITSEFALKLGKCVGSTLLSGSKVCIATDTRTSRDMVKYALVSGLLSCGINVTDFGILPTPILAALTQELKFDTGIMITASHNPPEFNGIKIFNVDSTGYDSNQEKKIERLVYYSEFRTASWEKLGSFTFESEAPEKYFEMIEKKCSKFDFNRELKLIIDPGNGAASGFVTKLFQRLGLSVIPLNDVPNGQFPGRNPEPRHNTLEKTIEYLKKEDAALAICFDGDGDRVVFCDKHGFIGYNEMVSFISWLKVKESGGKVVATTVETGRLLDIALEELDAKVIRSKVGDVNLAYLVRDLGASIGVEQVGVYIFPEMGYYPDSIFAALFLLSKIGDALEIRDFLRRLPPLFFEKAKIPCPNELKQVMLDKIGEVADQFSAKEINTLDGIRLEFNDSWMLIRASGTEPVIRVLVESVSQERAKELLNRGAEAVQSALQQYA